MRQRSSKDWESNSSPNIWSIETRSRMRARYRAYIFAAIFNLKNLEVDAYTKKILKECCHIAVLLNLCSENMYQIEIESQPDQETRAKKVWVRKWVEGTKGIIVRNLCSKMIFRVSPNDRRLEKRSQKNKVWFQVASFQRRRRRVRATGSGGGCSEE